MFATTLEVATSPDPGGGGGSPPKTVAQAGTVPARSKAVAATSKRSEYFIFNFSLDALEAHLQPSRPGPLIPAKNPDTYL